MDRGEHFSWLKCRRKNVDEEVLCRDVPRAVRSCNFEFSVQRNHDRRPIGSGIGGSLANADPAADWPAIVIALNAELEIAGPNGSRRVAAKDFFVDIFSTALEPTEVLTAVHIARPAFGARFTYRKIRHPASGYAVVGVAVGVRMEDDLVAEMSIGITGAASHAFSADVATEFLMAKPLSSETIEEAAKLASEATVCLADRYASAEYRASLVRTETKRGLLTLAA